MQLHELLSKLSGVKRASQGYTAKCPSHDDNRASLSLAEDSGRILIKCFAGCNTQDIITRLGLSFSDLFDKSLERPSSTSLGDHRRNPIVKTQHGTYNQSGLGRIHCIYPYVDAEGRLLYENVRYYPKDFRQRRFDVRGEPVWSLEGVTRVPYRLPELIAASHKGTDIFLCEGEKDADALRELGFTASSFKPWTAAHNEYIKGCNIILVRDHDLPGVTHANEAARLIGKTAASVKILDIWEGFELPEKGGFDISDYIKACVNDAGLDVDTIKERIVFAVDRSPDWKDPQPAKDAHYFVVRSGNAWLTQSKTQASPKRLFGDLWFEGEVCILFADTNVGKSILAVQIGDAIARGKGGKASYETEETKTSLITECDAQKVIYFDFELTAKQFESRFAERDPEGEHFINQYVFPPNFYRAEIDPETSDMGDHKEFNDFLNASIESAIASIGAKVVIIDNLTYLRDETENARNALPLMKYLKSLKSHYGLSILALAHTPKRDVTKPLGRNDLQGSKMLINFCDSSFAIGESSRIPGMRYIKQIKARNSEIVYHAENVLMANVTKPSNFLHFQFLETASEADHIQQLSRKQRDDQSERIKQLYDAGNSLRKIGEIVGVSAMTVSRTLKKTQTREMGLEE
jgi:archaellum biogenesis ATPase FlaH